MNSFADIPNAGTFPTLQAFVMKDRFRDLASKYGPILKLSLGPITLVLVTSPSLVKRVFTDNQAFKRGSFTLAFGDLGPGGVPGLTLTEGDDWWPLRKEFNPEFHRRNIPKWVDLNVEEVEKMIQRIKDHSGVVSVYPQTSQYAWNFMSRLLFSGELDQEGAKILAAPLEKGIVGLLPRMVLSDGVKAVWDQTPMYTSFMNARERAEDFINTEIVRRNQAILDGESFDDILTLLNRMYLDGIVDRDRLVAELNMFMTAGHETTANALARAIHHGLVDKRVFAKLKEEALRVFGSDRPNSSHYSQLTYAAAVVEEVLRMFPPTWFNLREAMTDVEMDGYLLPKGTTVMVSPWVTHYDPKYWPNPHVFDPDRHLDSQARPDFALYPFSGGPHKCLGFEVALVELRYALAMLALEFEGVTSPEVPVTWGTIITTRPTRVTFTMKKGK